jgi:hypothetical protein
VLVVCLQQHFVVRASHISRRRLATSCPLVVALEDPLSTSFSHMSQRPCLTELPAIMLEHILTFCSPVDSCRVATTCHAMHAAAFNEGLWKSLYRQRWPALPQALGARDEDRDDEYEPTIYAGPGQWRASYIKRDKVECRICAVSNDLQALQVPGHGVLCTQCAWDVSCFDREFDV